MATDLFASICMMNTLRAMSPNELTATIQRLGQHNIIIDHEDNYITLVLRDVQLLFGSDYKSWEIVKNNFTDEEVDYLVDIGFRRSDETAFQAWGELAA